MFLPQHVNHFSHLRPGAALFPCFMENSQNASGQDTETRFTIMQKIFRASVYYFIGLSIFFIVGFIIISVRVSIKNKVEIPSVTGKLYLDVHNNLTDLGLKIEIKNEHTTEYPYGFILFQSLSPGKIVKEGSRITLVVNQSQNIVKVPRLVEMKEDLVQNILNNIHIGSRNFRLIIGTVTRIPSDRAKGEILAQFPEAGTPVVPDSPVSLLVSLGAEEQKSAFKFPDMENIPIGLAKEMAFHLKIPITIKVKAVNDESKHARIIRSEIKNPPQKWIETATKTSWNVTTAFFPYEYKSEDGPFKHILVNPDDHNIEPGKYTLAVVREQKNPGGFQEDHKYMVLSYLEIGKDPFPSFIFEKEKLALWKGHYVPFEENSNALSLEEKKSSPEGEEKGKIVFDNAGKKTEKKINREPDYILSLDYKS